VEREQGQAAIVAPSGLTCLIRSHDQRPVGIPEEPRRATWHKAYGFRSVVDTGASAFTTDPTGAKPLCQFRPLLFQPPILCQTVERNHGSGGF